MPGENERSGSFEVLDIEPSGTFSGGPSGIRGNVPDIEGTSPFDFAGSGDFERILREAEGSGEYDEARYQVLRLVERRGIREHRERLLQMVDEYEGGATGENKSKDKGKERDGGE